MSGRYSLEVGFATWLGLENVWKGRWRKVKGVATVRLQSGRIRLAELPWYEAQGIGRKEMKRKR